jgi:hypothetical protein
MRRVLMVVVAALLLAAWAPVPKSYRFDTTSPEGLFIVELTPALPLYREGTQVSVDLLRFDPDSNDITANALKGWASVNEVKLVRHGRIYIVGRAKPGRYVLRSLELQKRWTACFNTATVQLDIKPGAVVFLGRIDPNQPLLEVATKAPRSTRGFEFVMDSPRLDLTPPANLGDWRTPVSEFLAANHAGVTAPLEAADVQPAVFRTGVGFRGEKICSSFQADKRVEAP